MKRVLLVLVLLVLAGCLGNGGSSGSSSPVSAETIRADFVESNTSSYAYNSTTEFEISTQRTGTIQSTTVETEAVINHAADRVRVNQTFTGRSGGGAQRSVTRSGTRTYLVNGSVYTRTVRNGNRTGWLRFDDSREINRTWEAREEIALYTDVLRGASVAHEGTEMIRGTEAHRLSVELDSGGRRNLFLGKFGDRPGFFSNETEFEEFNTTVWISNDTRNLLRAETTATLTTTRTVRSTTAEFEVSVKFADEFFYNRDETVKLPDAAADAQPAEVTREATQSRG